MEDVKLSDLSSNLPPVKIVGDDGGEIMRPDVINFVTQLAQLAQITKLRKLEESKVPVGITTKAWLITDQAEYSTDPPWTSFTLINDGPGAVFVQVNEQTTGYSLQDPVPVGGKMDVDFKYPIINRLFFQCVNSDAASLRIKAIYGKWA